LSNRRFQIAISFAGAQRGYAERLAKALQSRGVAVFYDSFFRHEILGKDLTEYLHRVYAVESNFVAMLISNDYVNRIWTKHERRSAMSRALKENGEYILPIRFDESWPEGIPDSIGFEEAKNISPEALAIVLCRKLGIDLSAQKASSVPAPQLSSVGGDVQFDYESFNGRYIIGNHDLMFETMWSDGGTGSIHSYNDPESLQGIAIANDVKAFGDIDDASRFDFSSRRRTPKVGEYLILRNVAWFYAALQILEVRVRTQASPALLRFFYIIQSDGSADFRQFSVLD
jgi:hypothetical protein